MKKLLLILSLMMAVAEMAYAIFPMRLRNGSEFADSEIYIAIVGQSYANNGGYIYYDLSNNNAGHVQMNTLNESVNTLHKTNGDWGYANIFTKLSNIANKTIYIDRSFACRMFIGFKSPMYLHAFNQTTTFGYAGANLQNPSDPNIDLRWEVIEFTYDQYDVMFVNTTRVDAFQYPMGIELYGNTAAGANNAYMKRGDIKSYTEIMNLWTSQLGGTVYKNCKVDYITKDNLGGIIMQPSKIDAVKNANVFDNYINNIWNTFRSKRLHANMGDLGEWTGSVSGDVFTMTRVTDGAVGKIYSKPSTTDAIEGAGAFASGNGTDLALQAMFCGAINRGMIDLNKGDNVLQNWGDASKFYTMNTWNEYVKFFHQSSVSYQTYTYAFAYDDTFDQSSTCATSHPDHLSVNIGGFVTDQGEGYNGNSGGGNDAVSFKTLTSGATLSSASSYNIAVDYTASTTRDVYLCMYDNSGTWNVIGEVHQQVSAGSGTINFTLPVSPAPASGTNGYIFKCDIRPTGGAWDTYKAMQLAENISISGVSYSDDVSFKTLTSGSTIASASSYSIAVNYSASTNRDIYLCMYDNSGTWNVIGEVHKSVSAGTGTINFTLPVSPTPTAGTTGYIFKADVRPTGGAWDSAIKMLLVENISIETAQNNYDKWILSAENPTGNFYDVRWNEIYAWSGVEGKATTGAYEGTGAIAWTINATETWWGWGIHNEHLTLDMSSVKNWYICFAIKTNCTDPLAVKIAGTNGEYSVALTGNYAIARNGYWQTMCIPFSAFTSQGMQLGSQTGNVLFSIVCENATNGSKNKFMEVDNVYYSKTSITPTQIVERTTDKVAAMSIWPNPATDRVQVKGVSENATITIYDMTGRALVVEQAEDGKATIDITRLGRGNYIVRADGQSLHLVK
ncbi:MAG: T9SS type A sorting domain-containing protein [Paludibacteraceae bacterium]|nr:T9SS type A sorting domain-containing protein [Paludibacteraceae bacterium]